MLAPKTDGRCVTRVDMDWETRNVSSEQTSTIEGIAGWHFPDRNNLMSLTRQASLLSPSSSSLRNNRSISAWHLMVLHILYERLFSGWHRVSLDMSFPLEKTEEQYSICDLIRAVFNNFNSSLGRYEVGLANIARNPWYLLKSCFRLTPPNWVYSECLYTNVQLWQKRVDNKYYKILKK